MPPYLLLIHSDKLACQASPLRLSLHVGVVRSRWASWSSTPVAGRVAGRGGFDSHPLSPILWRARKDDRYRIKKNDIDGCLLLIYVFVFK
jgi:hypothetical protein